MSHYDFEFERLPFFGSNKEINSCLAKAARRLEKKLAAVAPKLKETGFSTYSQRYMDVVFGTKFRRRYNITKYAHILSHGLQDHSAINLGNITLVDYGGGHGTLSLLAKEVGVGNVIHSDIFSTSSRDAQKLAKAIDAPMGFYFVGDSDDFRAKMELFGQRADVIVNYDVLEHIYNFRRYFLDLAAVTNPGGRWYMGSGANSYNPTLREKLLGIHSQFEGVLGDGNPAAYANFRASRIAEQYPELLPQEVEKLAFSTRGWRMEDIQRAVEIYLSSGHVVTYCPPENNTADPRNGNWQENTVTVESYLDSPVLNKLADAISVEACAEWTAFIDGDESECRRWYEIANRNDHKEALRVAPYYCMSAKMKVD